MIVPAPIFDHSPHAINCKAVKTSIVKGSNIRSGMPAANLCSGAETRNPKWRYQALVTRHLVHMLAASMASAMVLGSGKAVNLGLADRLAA